MGNETRDKILKFLKTQDDYINTRKVADELGISYPTALKHCDILLEGNKIEIKILSNMKLIKIKEARK